MFVLAPVGLLRAQSVIQWKFVPGESHDYRLTQTARLESGAGKARTQIADVAEQIDFTWKVVEVDAEGTATLSVQVNSYALTAKGPDGQEVTYDSQSASDPQGYAAMLLPIGRRLSEEPVQLSMSPQGIVKLLDLPIDLADAVKSVPGGKLFAKDGGAGSFESLARLGGPLSLPTGEVQEGSTWKDTLEMEIPALGKAAVKFEYQIGKLPDNNRISIEQHMLLSPLEDAEARWSLDSQTSTGEVQFDSDSGRSESSSLSYKAELISESNPSMTLEQNVKFTSLSDTTQ